MVEKFPLFHYFFTVMKKRVKSFLPKQCSLIDNASTFPLITDKSLLDVDFSIKDIKNIINKLDSNKACGDDMINVRMLK